MKAFIKILIALLLILAVLVGGWYARDYIRDAWDNIYGYIFGADEPPISLAEVPEFSGEPYVVINDGEPFFTKEEITTKSYETYSELDELGRCGVVMACIGRDLMPTEDRGEINNVTPSGWVQAQYDCVSGKYLYHRCHLIGFQLTGENDNEKNLITGTQYLNIEGMLPFENMIADYVKETGNHVMYRVTPIYNEKYDLVPCGVLMEAYSVEDEGEGIKFNVYCYNNQPGVEIDYYDGRSWETGTTPPPKDEDNNAGDGTEGGDYEGSYVINTSTKKIHLPSCRYASSNNTEESTKTLEELLAENYTACGVCKPDESE